MPYAALNKVDNSNHLAHPNRRTRNSESSTNGNINSSKSNNSNYDTSNTHQQKQMEEWNKFLAEFLSLHFPRCSVCNTSWYNSVNDDECHNNNGEVKKPKAKQKERSKRQLKQHKQIREDWKERLKCRELIQLPKCKCETRLVKFSFSPSARDSIIQSLRQHQHQYHHQHQQQSKVQRQHEKKEESNPTKNKMKASLSSFTSQNNNNNNNNNNNCSTAESYLYGYLSEILKEEVVAGTTANQDLSKLMQIFPNKAMCKACLIKTISISDEVIEHDYRDSNINGQRNEFFTVEPKCVNCRQKFTKRTLEKLVNILDNADSADGDACLARTKRKRRGEVQQDMNNDSYEWKKGVQQTVDTVKFLKRVALVLFRYRGCDPRKLANTSRPIEIYQANGDADTTDDCPTSMVVKVWLNDLEDHCHSSDDCSEVDSDDEENDNDFVDVGLFLPLHVRCCEAKTGEIKEEFLQRKAKLQRDYSNKDNYTKAKMTVKKNTRARVRRKKISTRDIMNSKLDSDTIDNISKVDLSNDTRQVWTEVEKEYKSEKEEMLLRLEQEEEDAKLARLLNDEFNKQLNKSLRRTRPSTGRRSRKK